MLLSKKHDTNANADLSKFSDSIQLSLWAEEPVGWIVATEIMSGRYVNGKLLLDPQGLATRAECVAIIMKYMEYFGE